MRQMIDWRSFFILLGVSILSVFAVFPYVVTLQGELFKQAHISISLLFLLQLIQSTVIFSILIFIGLNLVKKIGFSLPLLEAILQHTSIKKVLNEIALKSILLGFAAAISIYVLDYFFTISGEVAISTHQNPAPVWQRLLAAFYGGTTEEIVMRLFLMTLFIWLGMKVTRQRHPTQLGIIIPIILAAIIFGLGHLPITAALTAITPLVVIRAVILNGIGGIIFGWLYWKKGLEAAMISHFSTDIFLLVILPLLFNY